MKKYQFLSILFLFPMIVWGQPRSYSYWTVLNNDSTPSIERIQIVDSLTNLSFRDGFPSLPWGSLRKSDFSDTAKETLLNYLLDRTLPNYIIEDMKNRKRIFMQRDSYREFLWKEAERRNIEFNIYFEQVFEEQINQGIEINKASVLKNVPEIIPLLLGWLEYEPALPVLNSVLTDSIRKTGYAEHNRKSFESSVKLALARMGNREYEKEFLDLFSTATIATNRIKYWKDLKSLYYINTKQTIDRAIESLKEESLYIETDNEIPGELIYSSRNLTLISLYFIIQDYPLNFKELYDKKRIDSQHRWGVFSYSVLYKEQFPFLENWLNEHKSSYLINRDIFIDVMGN